MSNSSSLKLNDNHKNINNVNSTSDIHFDEDNLPSSQASSFNSNKVQYLYNPTLIFFKSI